MERELRAVWVHQFEYILNGTFKRENIQELVDDLAKYNFTHILFCVKAPGILYYPSKVGSSHPYFKNHKDIIPELAERAHNANIEVHSYFPVFLDGGFSGKSLQSNLKGGILAQLSILNGVVWLMKVKVILKELLSAVLLTKTTEIILLA